MKLFSLILVSLISTSAMASTELVLQTSCDRAEVTGDAIFVTSAAPGDNRVKARVTLVDLTMGTDSASYDELKTPVLASLERKGNVIVHQKSGRVCSKLVKPLLGQRNWSSTGKCTFSQRDKETSQLDRDGFEKITTCVRSVYLNIK